MYAILRKKLKPMRTSSSSLKGGRGRRGGDDDDPGRLQHQCGNVPTDEKNDTLMENRNMMGLIQEQRNILLNEDDTMREKVFEVDEGKDPSCNIDREDGANTTATTSKEHDSATEDEQRNNPDSDFRVVNRISMLDYVMKGITCAGTLQDSSDPPAYPTEIVVPYHKLHRQPTSPRTTTTATAIAVEEYKAPAVEEQRNGTSTAGNTEEYHDDDSLQYDDHNTMENPDRDREYLSSSQPATYLLAGEVEQREFTKHFDHVDGKTSFKPQQARLTVPGRPKLKTSIKQITVVNGWGTTSPSRRAVFRFSPSKQHDPKSSGRRRSKDQDPAPPSGKSLPFQEGTTPSTSKSSNKKIKVAPFVDQVLSDQQDQVCEDDDVILSPKKSRWSTRSRAREKSHDGPRRRGKAKSLKASRRWVAQCQPVSTLDNDSLVPNGCCSIMDDDWIDLVDIQESILSIMLCDGSSLGEEELSLFDDSSSVATHSLEETRPAPQDHRSKMTRRPPSDDGYRRSPSLVPSRPRRTRTGTDSGRKNRSSSRRIRKARRNSAHDGKEFEASSICYESSCSKSQSSKHYSSTPPRTMIGRSYRDGFSRPSAVRQNRTTRHSLLSDKVPCSSWYRCQESSRAR